MLSSKTNALLTHTLASFWRKQSCYHYYYIKRREGRQTMPHLFQLVEIQQAMRCPFWLIGVIHKASAPLSYTLKMPVSYTYVSRIRSPLCLQMPFYLGVLGHQQAHCWLDMKLDTSCFEFLRLLVIPCHGHGIDYVTQTTAKISRHF